VHRQYSDPGEPSAERFHAAIASPVPGNPQFDLVHSTCSYINPEMIDFPGILTIQDLQHLHYPEFFSKADLEDRERLYRESASRARHIICSSEFTRRDVHERYGVALEKMTTIWNIPSSAVWRTIPLSRRRRLLGAMGVDGPFLLYPAHCWPHKNHARLLQAVDSIAQRLPTGMKVVLTGNAFPDDHPAASLIRERGLASRVVHLGYRSPLEVRALFQECTALVFPSLFEGFGMPVAEALIAGKAVACSNAASLPEIAGEAAVTFDPRNVEEMSARILEVATQPALRASLEAAACRRRPLFSAGRSVVKTLAVYEYAFRRLREAA
jgi:glycosyltransferase involved in cell wall biosynthesis